MRAVFVETSAFSAWLAGRLPDDAYLGFQQLLMANPESGAVMTGCGGLRKIRVPDPLRSSGKRGGLRVVYLYVPDVRRFYMIFGYEKGLKDDLTSAEKKELFRLAIQFKGEGRKQRPGSNQEFTV